MGTIPAHPGFPAFSKIFHRETNTRTRTASHTRKNAPPNRAPTIPAPRPDSSSWNAANRSIISIDHLASARVCRADAGMLGGRGQIHKPARPSDGIGGADDAQAGGGEGAQGFVGHAREV